MAISLVTFVIINFYTCLFINKLKKGEDHLTTPAKLRSDECNDIQMTVFNLTLYCIGT